MRTAPQPTGSPNPVHEVPLRHPAFLLVTLAAAAGILLSVSFQFYDSDIFQHLRVGRMIWETHSLPRVHLWSWPIYGMPEVLPSWLFRVLLWPFWAVGGVWGLFTWRWLTTLIAFGLLWATSRRMGARGFVPLVILVVCSLIYRQRSQARPETMVAILLAFELWILETRRQGGPDRTPWLVAVAWVWANTHVSYYMGIGMTGLFWLDGWLGGRGPGRARTNGGDDAARAAGQKRLGIVLLASVVVSFLNPYDWRALWMPFDFYLHLRHELLYHQVGELMPIQWDNNRVNGLIALLIGWPVLVISRAARRRFDAVEAVLMAVFTTITLFGQRFLGFYAVVAAPYVARDLAWLLPSPRWLGSPWRRGALAALACVAVGAAEWSRPVYPLGVRMLPLWYPKAACDFMAQHGVRGRGFNDFGLSGYLLYRFWPERDRLPFMDIHMASLPADRDAYARAFTEDGGPAWRELDGRYHFDYALLSRRIVRETRLLDVLDADTSFALVFSDDIGGLFVRRRGALGEIAARHAYSLLPAGGARVATLQRLCTEDAGTCDRLAAELERSCRESDRNSQAHSFLANIALMRGEYDTAREHLRAALAVDPFTARAHERLGLLALEEHHPTEALREFQSELRLNGASPGLDFRMGQAYRRLGQPAKAAHAFERELHRNPTHPQARDSLAAVTATR